MVTFSFWRAPVRPRNHNNSVRVSSTAAPPPIAATFRKIRHSPLVNIPSNATDIYVVEEIDEDDLELRHIPNPDAFNRAGCDWDGVFQMSSGEYEHWQERATTQGRQLHAGPIDTSYRCP